MSMMSTNFVDAGVARLCLRDQPQHMTVIESMDGPLESKSCNPLRLVGATQPRSIRNRASVRPCFLALSAHTNHFSQ